MLKLIDGPCQGEYFCQRAPFFLRAVLDKDGGKDVLDLVEDIPSDTETIYIYQLQGEPGFIFVDGTKGGRRCGSRYATGEYRHLPDIDGSSFRNNDTWQSWALSHAPAAFKHSPLVPDCPIDGMSCDRQLKACCSCERNNKRGD